MAPGSQRAPVDREEVRPEPRHRHSAAAAAATTSVHFFGDMDPQTVLPRALLLFLFLHLSPLGGRSYPLRGPSTTSDLSGMQELPDGLQDTASELQAEQMALELLQQVRVLEEAWEAPEAASSGVSGPQDNTLQALRGPRSPKLMHDSGCFGQRLDRIGSLSGLGCSGQQPALHNYLDVLECI
ncbi:hypothetical protein MC885_003851 [Smutsia gigantea]|nr:hypothetical protein MC885_003851 [Smutsia gigantea]